MPFRAERKCQAAFRHRIQGQRRRKMGPSRDGLAVLSAGLPGAHIQVIADDLVNFTQRADSLQSPAAA